MLKYLSVLLILSGYSLTVPSQSTNPSVDFSDGVKTGSYILIKNNVNGEEIIVKEGSKIYVTSFSSKGYLIFHKGRLKISFDTILDKSFLIIDNKTIYTKNIDRIINNPNQRIWVGFCSTLGAISGPLLIYSGNELISTAHGHMFSGIQLIIGVAAFVGGVSSSVGGVIGFVSLKKKQSIKKFKKKFYSFSVHVDKE